jgi:hypothetical protein
MPSQLGSLGAQPVIEPSTLVWSEPARVVGAIGQHHEHDDAERDRWHPFDQK